MRVRQGWLAGGILIAVVAILAGCNQSADTDTANTESDASDATGDLPIASIEGQLGEDDNDDDDDDAEVAVKEPEEGTPEWHIREILRVRLKPFPELKTASNSEDGSDEESDPEQVARQQASDRRERHEQVIDLAKQAIALSHKKPDKEIVFNAAVHHLLDARLQLALEGEQADVDALYEICEALQQSKPNTEIASAAALTIVNFSHANAVRYAESEPKWIQEFAKQAQLFAARVSESQPESTAETADGEKDPQSFLWEQDASRAAQILTAAGQSCEAAGFQEDAKACYLMVKSKYPDTPQAQYVAGILRRYNLQGKPLQLAGPTLDGNFLSIEDFKGKTVVVVFWSSQAKPFVDDLPVMLELLNKSAVQKYVSVIGVSLDTDESQLDAFLTETGLTWPQIFHAEPEKRGWNSPIATYYGINQLPTVWIVDPSGSVAETHVSATELKPKLENVVRNSRKAGSQAGSGKIVPAGNKQTDP
jgi:hypothetical protein